MLTKQQVEDAVFDTLDVALSNEASIGWSRRERAAVVAAITVDIVNALAEGFPGDEAVAATQPRRGRPPKTDGAVPVTAHVRAPRGSRKAAAEPPVAAPVAPPVPAPAGGSPAPAATLPPPFGVAQ